MRNLARWWIAIPVLALMGCSFTPKVINAYDGPERSDREVAILYTPEIPSPSIERSGGVLSAVEGKVVGSYMDGYPRATRVLPGTYLLKIGCLEMVFQKNLDFNLVRTTLEAGHFYELLCERYSASAVDRGTNYQSVERSLPGALKDQLRR